MPGVNRLLPVVRPAAPVLLLCGYYGEHNLGDDALLQVLVSSIPEPQQLLITARDPAPVLALAPSAQTVNRRSLRRCLRAALSCLLYTSPSPRDVEESRMPSSA